MSLNQSLIAELQMEAANTRKMLGNVPCEKNDWKPHEKSMTLGKLASHVTDLPGWISFTLNADELDLAKTDFKAHIASSGAELISMFDKNLNDAISTLGKTSDDEFTKPWTLRRGDHVIFTMPKIAVIRSMAMSHMYHHRGQLSVYMRLLNVPVPGMYGPSHDDTLAMAAAQAN